jgi:hypothetical protein
MHWPDTGGNRPAGRPASGPWRRGAGSGVHDSGLGLGLIADAVGREEGSFMALTHQSAPVLITGTVSVP